MEGQGSKKTSVYRPTRIFSAIDSAINKLVEEGEYVSYNAAVNGLLNKTLKVTIKKNDTLRELEKGEKFKFANPMATKTYKVKEDCLTDKKKRIQTRVCEELKTGKIIPIACKSEVIKIK